MSDISPILPVKPSEEEPPAKTGRSAAIVAINAQTTYLLVLAGMGFLAYMRPDSTLIVGALITLVGGAMSNAGTVVNYYLGSSSSSARKTEIIATKPPPV